MYLLPNIFCKRYQDGSLIPTTYYLIPDPYHSPPNQQYQARHKIPNQFQQVIEHKPQVVEIADQGDIVTGYLALAKLDFPCCTEEEIMISSDRDKLGLIFHRVERPVKTI